MTKMTKTSFIRLASAVFSLVALLHLWILLTGANISIGSLQLGSWVNYIAFIIAGYMGIAGYTIKK